jgi:hypothetical protein
MLVLTLMLRDCFRSFNNRGSDELSGGLVWRNDKRRHLGSGSGGGRRG